MKYQAHVCRTSSNAIPATVWFCVHIYQDQTLLSRARKEVSRAANLKSDDPEDDSPKFDIPTLCGSPLLQSMFAEILRLYQAVALMRMSDNDLELDGWQFRKHRMIFLCSRTVYLNAKLWNIGSSEKPHPIDQFWSDRFLAYPGDRASVTWDGAEGALTKESDGQSKGRDAQPFFSLQGLENCWVPFGGGATMCPGRTFAKNEMLASFAMLSHQFDVELLVPRKNIVPDMNFFSISMLPPKAKIPFRIRRKSGNESHHIGVEGS